MGLAAAIFYEAMMESGKEMSMKMQEAHHLAITQQKINVSDPFTGKQLRDIAMDRRGVVVTVTKLCSDWENDLTTEKFRSGWNHD